MVDRGGGGGLDQGKIIGDRAKIGEELGEPHATFSMLIELKHGGRDKLGLALGHGGDALTFVDGFGEFFFESFVEIGLVIEKVELGRSATHKEKDDTLCGGFWEVVTV